MPETDTPDLIEQNSMDYWWPRLQNVDVPVPYTKRVDAEPVTIEEGTIHEMTMKIPDTDELREAVLAVGGPDAFLRTDHASDKHGMASGSHVRYLNETHLRRHAFSVAEHNETAGMMGIPYDSFYVREWLDLNASFTAFDGLPIASELRYFIHDGEIHDYGFYWPHEAIRRPNDDDWEAKLTDLREHALTEAEGGDNYDGVPTQLTEMVAEEFNTGYWSVDFAETEHGEWYCIDMARGERSFHPDGCEKPEALQNTGDE